ncbi:MAG: hypothetical protein AAF236_06400 [Verrucomicrobiota bacterium]
MKDPIITYRGATAKLSEVSNQRVAQLEQQQGTRRVQYRGAQGEVAVGRQAKQTRTISYRGATAEMAV